MSAGAISGSFLPQNQQTQVDSNAFAELDSGEFLNILLTELTNQDPFEPNDSQALLEQLSALRNIESQTALQDKLEALVLQNNISQAGALLGKVVEGLNANGDKLTGQVMSVRVVDGKAELELDTGRTLALERITRVTERTATQFVG
ncbi:MAG: hypothetical protein GVY24_05250 [Planctomycetes bacterium]|jgi:flagellar basal-body rod modification protein FlgD|nr:hypothetical protein [Planctomycetota bacterium]